MKGLTRLQLPTLSLPYMPFVRNITVALKKVAQNLAVLAS